MWHRLSACDLFLAVRKNAERTNIAAEWILPISAHTTLHDLLQPGLPRRKSAAELPVILGTTLAGASQAGVVPQTHSNRRRWVPRVHLACRLYVKVER